MFAFRLFTFVVSLLLPLTLSYGQKDHRFTLFTLCRNSDLNEMAETILNYNLRVENISNYDWVFLNDQPFSPEFEKLISSIVQGRARFGIVDPEIWNIPSHIDQNQMKFNIEQALNDEDGPYPYADSITYRNMCRFMSGGFQWHPLMLEYTHFWRVEPGVKLYCDTEIVIEDYAFTISMIEYPKTVTTLMDSVIEGLESLGLQHLLSPDKITYLKLYLILPEDIPCVISGQTLKLVAWISFVATLTKLYLISWTVKVASTMKGGGMHQ